MRLGTRLLRDGVIGLSELEAALRAQVLYGGRLGTNLVELGFLDIDTLGRYVALTAGAPEATRDCFEAAPADAIERFGAEAAGELIAFPLGPAPGNPSAVALAVTDADTPGRSAAIEARLGQPVVLYAAPEMRLFFYLEKHYGIERPIRFVRPSSPPRQQGKVERRRVQGAPPTVRVEPRRSRGSKIHALRPAARAAIVERIDAATHRDPIIDAVLELAPGRFDVLIALLVRDSRAMGWRSYSAHVGATHAAVEQLSLPLGAASGLKLAHASGEPYFGPPTSPPRPIEEALWSATATPDPPAEILVVPVTLEERIVHLLYAHRARGIVAEARHDLEAVASRTAAAYLRLIQSLKAGD